jgi:hypothetical protein
MLTGELPLGRFPLPSTKVHVDVRLDEVVLKTLEKEPQRRYQHASEVKIDVETISAKSPAPGPKEKPFKDAGSQDDTEAIRHRVWIPAVGLLVAGGINCLASIGLVLAALASFLSKGFSGELITFDFLPGAVQVIIVVATVAYAIFVLLGGWNLMQLRSRRLAMAGGILALYPFSPGSVVGLPMGIWALVVMRSEQVKAAFGQERIEVAVPPKVRDFAVSAAGDVKVAFEQGKAEVEKIMGRRKTDAQRSSGLSSPGGVSAPRNIRGMAIGVFVLGFVSTFITSLSLNFASRFTLVFLAAFFAVFYGVIVMRSIRPYRKHLLDAGLAAVGILMATISVITLFNSL